MKASLIGTAMFLVAAAAFAAGFSPTPLKISAPSLVKYDFAGKDLTIPVTVTGTDAGVVFAVFTKDKSGSILKTRNGFLGWHYVNKVDTSVFISPLKQFSKGSNTLTWNGKGEGGMLVAAGEYTYYLWGYDNMSNKTRVHYKWYPYNDTDIVAFDGQGKPLAEPIIYKPTSKWVIGHDPADSVFIETTTNPLPSGWARVFRTCFHPGDMKYYYLLAHNQTAVSQAVWKYQWVPNGISVVQTAWADNGAVKFSKPHYQGSGVSTDREYLYAAYYGQYENGTNINLYKIEFDGTLNTTFDLTEWMYHQEDWTTGKAQSSGGPTYMPERNGKLFLDHYGSCIKAMIDPSVENAKDLFVWVNQNGDYINDHNDLPTSSKPWVCFDFNVAPYTYTMSADANLWSITSSYDMGAVSFALMAPDGTGVSYLAYAGETAGWKYGDIFLDSGSAFDGIYSDNVSTAGGAESKTGTWYVAHDSIKGVIGTEIGVADATPSAFRVEQNVPNPFNPTTEISITIPSASHVKAAVYNTAGQRIDTLVDSRMAAGRHTFNWNAARFSGGIYFCTVEAGGYSKTVKMTLLK